MPIWRERWFDGQSIHRSGVFVGPYDLSGSMGMLGQVGSPVVQRKIGIVLDYCAKVGVPAGAFFPNDEAYLASPDRGRFDFVAIGTDLAMIARGVSQNAANAKNLQL